jgi:hypothetical protein
MRKDLESADSNPESAPKRLGLSRRGFIQSVARATGGGLVLDSLWSQNVFASRMAPDATAYLPSKVVPGSMTPADSVPIPSPAKNDYLIGAMYFGGWEVRDARSPWDAVRPFPDRRPILGYYDGTNPAVADWEIKWALESGISYFVYCWYRKQENVGSPVTRSSLFLQDAIHEGLFKAKYVDQFKFAIMWENRQAGGISSEQDLLDNLLPFWIDNYFRHPSYLKVDGKPVLYVYGPEKLIQQLGGVEQNHAALEHLRAAMRKQGFPGILVFCEYHGPDLSVMARNLAAGFDVQFAYAVGPPWGGTTASGAPRPPCQRPTPEQVIAWEADYLRAWKQRAEIPFITTVSMGWDPMPWGKSGGPDYLDPDKMTRWRLSPEQFQTLLQTMKEFMATLHEGDLGSKMLLLDNWNEWGEGHFIAPHAGGGFGYLKAVREVFTRQNNKPDYRSPFELGLGPYDLPEPNRSNPPPGK